jgi:hypothetical protein
LVVALSKVGIFFFPNWSRLAIVASVERDTFPRGYACNFRLIRRKGAFMRYNIGIVIMLQNSEEFSTMRKLVPYKLHPIFTANCNPPVPCADCGEVIEFRHARIVMVDISDKNKGQATKAVSLDELARNIVWTILCQECWRQQYHSEVRPERVQ